MAKKQRADTYDSERNEWIEEKRDNFREQILLDLETAREDYIDSLEDGVFDYDDMKNYFLVGWKIELEKEVRCPKRKEIGDLIYLAECELDDIVEHLPPFDECKTECEKCDIVSVLFQDLVDSAKRNARSVQVNFFMWEGMKPRKSIPPYISRLTAAAKTSGEETISKEDMRIHNQKKKLIELRCAIEDAKNVEDNTVNILSPRQRGYLKYLGYTGSYFITTEECSGIIENLKKAGTRIQGMSYDECVAEAEANAETYYRAVLAMLKAGSKGAATKEVEQGGHELSKEIKIKSVEDFDPGTSYTKQVRLDSVVTKDPKKRNFFFACLKWFAALFGKGAAKGAKLAKTAAVTAIEYEKENKILARAATTAAEGAKKGAAAMADFLATGGEQPRAWLSADGKHTIEATLIDIRPESVVLKTTQEKQIEVRIAHLSAADHDYIAKFVKT